jgi:predicted transcriptional regulator
MPVGIVNDNDFQAELDRLNKPEIVKSHKGRSEGDINVPDSLRQVIADEAIVNGRSDALALANMFGVSPSSVSAYTNGATSTKSYGQPSKSLQSFIKKRKERVSKRAFGKMNDALLAINPDKLAECSARELASVAKDMSVIIKNMEPPPDNSAEKEGASKPQFVIFAPQFRKEEHYETIHVVE